MKKNKIIYTAFATATIFSLASCSDYLDELPDNRTELKTEKSIANILVSAYPKASSAQISEFYSDNTDENNSTYSYFNLLDQDLYRWKDTSEEDQDSPQNLWDECYVSIASANQALAAIEKLGNPASLDPQRGEALACRAYCHFMLANVFCNAYSTRANQDLGIPYMETTETTVSPQYTRGTLAEVYQKIETDLLAAIPLIDDNAYSVLKYHFNKRAAYAFAARFYLYYVQPDQLNYIKVIDFATRVLGASPSDYLRDWAAIGALSSNGDIQPNAFVDASNQANLLILGSVSWWSLVGDSGYSPCDKYSHNAATASEDCKSIGLWGNYSSFKQSPFNPGGSPKSGFRRVALYPEFDASGSSYVGHILMPAFTTDETLLCRAEAYAMLKRYPEAAADLTAWQKSFTKSTVTLTPEAINTFYGTTVEKYYKPEAPTVKKELHPDFAIENGMQENFIHCVLHMRRVLTLHDGLRWQDVKRYGIVIYRRHYEGANLVEVTDVMPTDDPRRAVQIPANVISAGMQPNPRNK